MSFLIENNTTHAVDDGRYTFFCIFRHTHSHWQQSTWTSTQMVGSTLKGSPTTWPKNGGAPSVSTEHYRRRSVKGQNSPRPSRKDRGRFDGLRPQGYNRIAIHRGVGGPKMVNQSTFRGQMQLHETRTRRVHRFAGPLRRGWPTVPRRLPRKVVEDKGCLGLHRNHRPLL